MSEEVSAEQVVVLDRSDLTWAREIAAANGVELVDLPSSAFEPVTTVAVILLGGALAVGAMAYQLDKRKGGQVIDLRPGAPKPFYRTTDVAYGLIVIVGLDGAVTVEVKEPKGMFGIVVDALRQAATDLAEVSIEAIAAIAKARFGDQIVVDRQPPSGPPDLSPAH